MKRFIRYLYEYEQGKRLRNVGFVKVEQNDEDCTLNIHGKGLHRKGERQLDLYLFFGEGDGCAGIWQGTVENVNPAINYRLFYTKEDVITPENFQKINGIILESETGRKYAAVWNDAVIDVGRMRALRPDAARKEEMSAEDGTLAEDTVQKDGMQKGREEEPMRQEESMPEDAKVRVEAVKEEESARQEESMSGNAMQGQTMQEDMQVQESPVVPEHAMHAGVPVEEEPAREEPAGEEAMRGMPTEEEAMRGMPAEEEAIREETAQGEAVQESPERGDASAGNRGGFSQSDADVEFGQKLTAEPIENICGDTREQMPKEHLRCTKIQRNDMARLPRCEWKWANNSFLLHGYYNYHHLAIIDDGERYRLGVPGIYHPQEAKAASTFGFTEFIPYKDMDVDLTDDEKSSQEQFGYWCRPIKRMLKTQ